jgi:2-enoate reductase
MVIGGGIAGMEAARVCALRGHVVALYERSDRLGGTLHSAGHADFKQDIARLLNYQVGQVEQSGNIRIMLMTDVTLDAIESENPDVVFVATGSTPLCEADIQSLDDAQWVTPDDVYKDNLPGGKDACVVGGGSMGCETALYLAKKGWAVVLVEMLDAVAADLFDANRLMLLELLKQYGVNLLTRSKVREAGTSFVLVDTPGGQQTIAADLLILCTGRQPVNGLAQAVRELVKEVYVIGDSVAPRKIKDAVWEAYKLAITV